MYKRIILIILDSVGLRAASDAALFGDEGASTIGHIYEKTGLRLKNMEQLGLGKLLGLDVPLTKKAGYAEMIPKSAGKDTIAGHWEMMGILLTEPLPVYPNGFSKDFINEFSLQINNGILGNKTASGTEIIKELGQLHIHSGKPILYTSADSVLQIAAHEDIITVDVLYEYCKIARGILQEKVGRIIARPFIGTYPNYKRTENRKDFALNPPQATVLDKLKAANISVYAIGKIEDIFAGKGITRSIHTSNNTEGMQKILQLLETEMNEGLLFANLVDFDSKYGHRRDAIGFARALAEFDQWLPDLLAELTADDLLLITADHGNDPCYRGTDHTRENTPLLIYGLSKNINFGQRGFADIGATILNNFNLTSSFGSAMVVRGGEE